MWKKYLVLILAFNNVEWTSYLNTMMSKEYDLAAGGWIGDYMDPLTFLTCGSRMAATTGPIGRVKNLKIS